MSKQKQEFLNRVMAAAKTAWDNTGKDEFIDENFLKALQKDGLVPTKRFVKNKKWLKHEPSTIAYKIKNGLAGLEDQEEALKNPADARSFAWFVPGADIEKCRKVCEGTEHEFSIKEIHLLTGEDVDETFLEKQRN